jgi:preprotein translocase subunit Sec61beta
MEIPAWLLPSLALALALALVLVLAAAKLLAPG